MQIPGGKVSPNACYSPLNGISHAGHIMGGVGWGGGRGVLGPREKRHI